MGFFGSKNDDDNNKKSKSNSKKISLKSIKPLAISVAQGLDKQRRAAKQNLMDYEGAAAGVTKQRTNADAMREREEGTMQSSGRLDNPQGIELAKSATGSATILGPAEIQKTAANNKGTTDTTTTAALTNIANKRKGKRETNKTAKKVLTEDYKLSKKILLG
jgi:hypothetical protein